MTRILGLGDNTIDTYVDAGVQYPGGNAVNVAAMAAMLGADAAYLGCIGDDEGGLLLREALTAQGLDISRVRVRHGANARAYIGHVDGDRHFIRSGPGVRADYRWEDDDFAYVATFDHVHTSVHSDLGSAYTRLSANVRSLSLDASDKWTQDYLADVVPQLRLLFLSASHLTDEEVHLTARLSLSLGAEVVVMTRGSAGAVGYDLNGPVAQPALPATVIDTLGAGDGFIAGFLTSFLASDPLPAAMAKGAEFAASVCGWRGGFGHGAPWSGDPDEARQPTAS